MSVSRFAPIVLLLGLAACGPAASDGPEPGAETGPCLEGACFDGLECLSDLCVSPDGGTEATSDPSAGPTTSPPDTGDDTTEPASTSTTGPAATSTTTSPEGTGATTSGAGDETGSSTTETGDGSCDVWAQNCPDGQKCAPWADDGGEIWNAARCVDVDPDPAPLGEPCTVQGPVTSGQDDCEAGAMCWGVGPRGEGICTALCTGAPANPACDAPLRCSLYLDDVVPLCLAECDPIAQNCPGGQVCYSYAGELSCAADGSGAGGAFLDACNMSGECNPGLSCTLAANLTGCEGFACCTPFCELGTQTCPGGTQCEQLFSPEQIPPGFELVGWCVG